MNFSLVFIPKAEKEYLDLPQKIRYQIEHDINTLRNNPIPDGKRIKKLQGTLLKIHRVLNRKDFDKYY